ncbi:MAG: phosphonate C-P lyase system protein PhnH, partial [Bryobacteraceae bacterium]|nr:phosphonate C-P lyase system protein PhnH [Bryobacteraceae bacterium]
MTEQVFPIHASIRQQTFRRLLHAMSMPGEIQPITDRACLPVFLLVLDTLVDGSVTLSDVDNLIPPLALRALRAPLTTSEEARFVLADASRSVVDTFRVDRGTLISPERGATVVLNGDSISANEAPDEDFLTVRLSGPGIAASRILALRGFHPS